MLNGIHLVDFGNHRNTRLTFGPMTALVGQNGSGKTTVMRAIRAIATALSEGVAEEIDVTNIRRGFQHAFVAASREESGRNGAHDFGVIVSERGTAYFRHLRVKEDQVWMPNPLAAAAQGPVAATKPKDRWMCRYFKTNGATLQGPSYSEEMPPRLGEDGTNLAWTLNYLISYDPECFSRIMGDLKQVVPQVLRVRSRAVPITKIERRTVTVEGQIHPIDYRTTVMGQELIFDMTSGGDLPAAAVSEGTLVVLAILTLVHYSDADLIMVDDIEMALHPHAQRNLMQKLLQILKSHPKLQIITSTHSPYVVDEIAAGDVWVFAPDKEGCAVSSSTLLEMVLVRVRLRVYWLKRSLKFETTARERH